MNAENQELILLAGKMFYHRNQYTTNNSKTSLGVAKYYEERVETKIMEIEHLAELAPPRFKLRVNRYTYPVFSY